MNDPTEASDRSPPSLKDLVALCLERMEREGSTVVEEICEDHPEHAERIRAAVGQIAASGLMEETQAAADRDWMPQQLGDYRLLERLGDGGMGVVYLASQEKLDRRVAVKLIRPDQLHVPASKDRLLREVRAVARLSHPGIVSVYDIGEERGMPFFSMEWIQGATLGELVEEFRGRNPGELRGEDLRQALLRRVQSSFEESSTDEGQRLFVGSWVQTCLRIVRRVAAALDHAHQHGVVHRDIKPSNVMLTPAGRVVLLDFGLAQMHGADKITQTGATVGSVAYMSPEQINHEELDPRTDVYSLGVTLYEALTLRAPFLGDNLGEVQWAILAGAPSSPRSLVATIPDDAETVCMMAMDRDRARRYASASRFAADLVAVLELQPIVAKRPGPLLRLRRWTQRHRSATLAVAMALVLVISLPLVYWWQDAKADQRVAEVHALADETLLELEQLTDGVRKRILDPNLRKLAGSAVVRRQLIEDVVTRFDSLRSKHPESARLLRRGIAMQQEFAAVHREVGDEEAALKAYRNSLDLCTTLAGLAGGTPSSAGVSSAAVAKESPASTASPGSATSANPANPAGTGPSAQFANVSSAPSKRAWLTLAPPDQTKVCVAWAGILTSFDSLDREDELHREGAAFSSWLQRAEVPAKNKFHHLFTLSVVMGQAADRAGHAEARDRWNREGIEQLTAGLERYPSGSRDPEALELRSKLGHLYTERGNFAHRGDDPMAARKAFEKALELHDEVVTARPDAEFFRIRRAGASRSYGMTLLAMREQERGVKVLESACADFRQLIALAPDDVGYASSLGGALNNLAQARMREKKWSAASKLLDEAIGHQRRAHQANVDNRTIRRFLTNHIVLKVMVDGRQQLHEGAGSVVDELVALGDRGSGELMAAFCEAMRYGACLDADAANSAAVAATYAERARVFLMAAAGAKPKDTRILGSREFRRLREVPACAKVMDELVR